MVIMSFHIQSMGGRIVMQVLMKHFADSILNTSTCQYKDRKQYKLEFEAAMLTLMLSACITIGRDRQLWGATVNDVPV